MQDKRHQRAVVLLADDDPGDQELIRRALLEDIIKTDFRVVSDGEEAMDYLQHRGRYTDPESAPRPDLMLLDLNMPKMDGKQVLAQIRADEELRHIVVVVLTTSDQETDILRSYDLGCNSFLTKPVNLDSFISTIRTLGTYWLELVTLPSAGRVQYA